MMLKTIANLVWQFIWRRPSAVAGVSTFAVAFTLVAVNALYSQPGKHPVPLWATRDALTTRSLPREQNTGQSAREEMRVLTKALTLDRIPVPLQRPDRRTVETPQPGESLATRVQIMLKDKGLYAGDIDGLVGPKTRKAITRFQQTAGLEQTGEVSAALLEAANTTTPQPQSEQIETRRPEPARLEPQRPEPLPASKIADVRTQPLAAPQRQPVLETVEAALEKQEEEIRPQPASFEPEQSGQTDEKDDARLANKAAFEPGIHEVRDSALIARVQIGLINFGETGIAVDGVMTDRTRLAIRAFQQRYGLAVTGVPDLAVIHKMEQIGALQKS